MDTVQNAWTLILVVVAGVVLIVVGLFDGGGWLVLAVGAALVAIAVGLFKLDPPGRRPYRGTWRPWRDVERRRKSADQPNRGH